VNESILRVFGLVTLLFAVLVAFTSRWTVFEAEALRDNKLNRREILQEQRIRRGTIRAADGTVLARSRAIGSGEERIYTREYPEAARLFAHALGYSYVRVGRAGLEESRNDELTGKTNDVETIFDELTGKQRVGNDIATTLDVDAQRVALDALAGRKGAVVALDPRTGAVKVMASVPGYDPAEVNEPGRFRALNAPDSGSPLVNRATQSGYPPGSTFKVVTTVAGIDSGQFTPQSQLSGKNNRVVSGVPLRNDANEDFGLIDFTTALTHSVNTYFAQVAEKVGRRRMTDYMERFGFYRKPPLDYPASQRTLSGVYVDGKLRRPTSPSVDLGRVGIGQGGLLVTPLQMAMVASAVANGGRLMEPHLTARVVDPDGRTIDRIEPELFSEVMKPETAKTVGDMMQNVVKEGTGTAAALEGIDVAGKTGTAEVGNPGSNLTQPWFIAFAPADDPRVAIAVTIERTAGGFGGTVAAPVAKQVMESLLR
jgi:peptidoglycan glycosyltransferase